VTWANRLSPSFGVDFFTYLRRIDEYAHNPIAVRADPYLLLRVVDDYKRERGSAIETV
jgi:hypothetical protein